LGKTSNAHRILDGKYLKYRLHGNLKRLKNIIRWDVRKNITMGYIRKWLRIVYIDGDGER
jgi:hypothetical protein